MFHSVIQVVAKIVCEVHSACGFFFTENSGLLEPKSLNQCRMKKNNKLAA